MSRRKTCRNCCRCIRTMGLYGISYICDSPFVEKNSTKGHINPDKINNCPHFYREQLNTVIYKKSKDYGVSFLNDYSKEI
jgi:hypothetical protein